MDRFLRFSPGVIILFIITALVGWQMRKPGIPEPSMPDVLGLAGPSISSPGWPTYLSPTPIPHLSLARIFAADHAWVTQLPAAKTVTMIATGDVIPARSVNHGMVTRSNFRWPFEKTAEVLSAADMTVINLETPLLANCSPTQVGMTFCGSSRAVEGLVFAGVDVATLGNNHAGNYYGEGVEETKRMLSDAGIVPVAQGVSYKDVKGMRFAFLTYNDIGAVEPGVPWADETNIPADIRAARANADVVIVAYHWGVEYVTEPNARQKYLAHLAIDSGADVVLGNHPHWIQPVEVYKEKFIIYAHGNFVFDQEWSEETKLGVIGRYTFFEGKLIDVEYVPIRIIDYGQPYFLAGEAAARVLRGMEDASIRLPGIPGQSADIPM